MIGNPAAGAATLAGPRCKAWAYFTGATGAVIKSGNCTIARTGVGTYTVTFPAAFADAGYYCDIGALPDTVAVTNPGAIAAIASAKTAGGCTLVTQRSAVAADLPTVWVGFYE